MKFWRWVIVAAAAAGIFLASKGNRTYWQRKSHLRDLEKELVEIRVSSKNLSQEIRRLKTDPRALEQAARRELGLIQPGEIEYRFVMQKSSVSKSP